MQYIKYNTIQYRSFTNRTQRVAARLVAVL